MSGNIKYLFTGASGFVGRQLWSTGLFPEARWLCRTARSKELPYTFIPEYSLSYLEPYLRQADVVVHLAAVTRDSRWPILNSGNVILTQNLADWVKKVNPGIRLIFMSSDLAGCSRFPYGRSKLLAENYLSQAGIDSVSLRVGMIAGKQIPGLSSKLSTLKSLSSLIAVPIFGNGRFMIHPLWIYDLAKVIVRLGERRGVINDRNVWSSSGEEVLYKDLIDFWRHKNSKFSICVPLPISWLLALGNFVRQFDPATTLPVDFLESVLRPAKDPPPDIFDHLQLTRAPWRTFADKI